MAATTPSELLTDIDIDDAFADIVLRNTDRTPHRLYSIEVASLVARLDWSDAALADRIEAALIVGAPFITSTRDGIWTIEIRADRRVNVTSIAGTASFAAAALSTRLLDLHQEFFAA